jgi:hypothetical protein
VAGSLNHSRQSDWIRLNCSSLMDLNSAKGHCLGKTGCQPVVDSPTGKLPLVLSQSSNNRPPNNRCPAMLI